MLHELGRATSSGSSARSRARPRTPRRRAARPRAAAARRRRGARAAAGRSPSRRPAQVLDLLEPAVAERVIFDLGLVRDLGYYTGAVFEVYDPALGAPIGGGGRYDDLLGRFGRPLPAVGFALGVDRLHIALAGEERGGMNRLGLTDRRPARRAASARRSTGSTRSGSTRARCAPTTASCCSTTRAS